MSSRNRRSASTPRSGAELLDLRGRRESGHRPAGRVRRGVRVVARAAVGRPGHPRHRRLAARLREAPDVQPAVHLPRLLRLRRGDVVGEQAHLGVVGRVAHDHRELDALQVVHLHVAGEPRLGARVGRRRVGERRQAPERERRDRDDEQGDGCRDDRRARARRVRRRHGRCSRHRRVSRRVRRSPRNRRSLRSRRHDTLPGASNAPVQAAPGSGTSWLFQYSSRNCAMRGSSASSTWSCVFQPLSTIGEGRPSKGERTT